MDWYALPRERVLEELSATEEGLQSSDALSRLKEVGPNALPDSKQRSWFVIFLSQFQSSVIYILLFAAGLLFAMGDGSDALIILAVLLLNALVGAAQEGKAENTLNALKRMALTNATVLRDGQEAIVFDRDIVPGDILILQEGDKIAADARIIHADSLRLDEASLTGESDSVEKHSNVIERADLALPDQKNMLFKGTYVVSGRGRAIVVATGVHTFFGGLSVKLADLDADVPLKKNIKALSRTIIQSVMVISTLLFFLGLLRGIPADEMLEIVIAVAVSAIPEGLPVVVTVILAAGMHRMSKRKALVKRLQAVEALGQAKVIAVDKTGTVTMNQMMVEKVYTNGILYDVKGSGYEPHGEIFQNGQAIESLTHDALLLMGKISALTSSSVIAYSEEKKEWQRISGDPTEAALTAFSQKIGFTKENLEHDYARLLELPFSSAIKYHAVAHQVGEEVMLSVAGAPEVVVAACHHVWRDGAVILYSTAHREEDEAIFEAFLAEGLRVLALAVRLKMPANAPFTSLPDLCFVGYIAIADSLRPEVHHAVRDAEAAGVRVVMITGDHAKTAQAIATKAGIYHAGEVVLTGDMIHAMSKDELAEVLPRVTVFARVTPDDKLTIIEAYKKRGEIVAMTGDGVNDVLSLAAADLGVAMGKIGTDAAKEAADIVLLDDNFRSIVAAIEEGRAIYRAIKKVILHLFSTSVGELAVIVTAIILGLPLPVVASQIIWLNFVTDGFLVIPLGLEPRETRSYPSLWKASKSLFDRTMGIRVALIAGVMTIGTILLFMVYLPQGYEKASTVALTILAVFQWANIWNCRSEHRSMFDRTVPMNMMLLIMLSAAVVLQIAAVYVPVLQKALHTVPLELHDWILILLVSLSVNVAEEIRKLFARRRV